MNLHAPQSVEAATELRMIAAVPLQIVGPRESVPLVSVVQDTLVGANRFTRPDVLFTRKEAMNLLVHAKRWNGKLPAPVVAAPQPMWSGQQLMSALLPPVSLKMKNSSDQMVSIFQGAIQEGTFDKAVFSKQLIHIIFNDYGPDMTVDFLDSLQAMIANFLMNNGFSVGISDLIADSKTNEEIQAVLSKITKTVEDQILQLHTGLFENSSGRTNQEEFEAKLMATLNKAYTEAGKIGLNSLSASNRMTNMVKAGSKGSDVNVSQMIATLGQIAIEGKRIPKGFQHRTLPHFKRFDDSAQARGFSASSFIKGLQPDEFFFHAMSGREGLIDTAVKTADTGYLQRKIRVALEDLVTQHDGSVRDAGGNLVQMAYGEDGANATKIEGQPLPIAEFSDEKLLTEYAAAGATDAAAYLDAARADRAMLVEKVYAGKPQRMVRYPVHLERLFFSIKAAFHLKDEAGTVTAQEVLEAQKTILSRTHANNRLWGALVRYHLRPTHMTKHGFTKPALDALTQQAILNHWKAWVEPGQPVGIIAAQSIGEPATQMTLNSVDFDTEILIARDGEILAPRIGEFIDSYIESCDKSIIQTFPNGQIYVPLDSAHDWSAVSCDVDGTLKWTKLEAITRHPVVNADGSDTILEVETESGRIVKATKARSFLTFAEGKIVQTNGSDLKIGDQLPVSNTLPLGDHVTEKTTFAIKTVLPPSEWLYGDEIAKALAALHKADAEGNRHWFSHANGSEFTVPYNRSDSFRAAFTQGLNTRADTFLPGFVYPKSTRSCKSQIPAVLKLDSALGYFVGAFLSEGSSSRTQIQITNNDDAFLAPIRSLMDSWSVGHHTVASEKTIAKTGIKGHTQSLIIHSTLLTTLFRTLFGTHSHNKTFPAWVLQAPKDFIAGLVDGYFSGDGSVNKLGYITAVSASKALVERMGALLARFGIHSTQHSWVPKKGKFDSVAEKHYNLCIPASFAKVFAIHFTLTAADKQARLTEQGLRKTRAYRHDAFADVILDKVKTIKEITPKGGLVYDVTVAETRNFQQLNGVGLADTFHLSGVAAKSNMTRGVPRLNELLKATKKPKATELVIPLRRDLREKKEEARRLAQELEFTLLKDIVSVARIYYDPRDNATLIQEDADWLAYLAAFEAVEHAPAAVVQPADPLAGAAVAGGAAAAAEPAAVTAKSPFILRFELDRERMFAKDITMDDIAFVLKSKFPEVETLYTDYNASRLVFRIRLLQERAATGPNTSDDLNNLKALQNKILTSTAIRGVPGLRAVNYVKTTDTVEYRNGTYDKVEQYTLVSDGSNFVEVIAHPDVDATRVVSSDIYDMFNNLGIEATRAVLYKEISTLFAESGVSVNYRHISVLLDKMCHKGRVMSVDRYGINKNDVGPLAKMSFEQTEDMALRAALFGDRDPCLGISAKVMLGAPIRAGTAFTEILLDEIAAIKLAESTPATEIKGAAAGPGMFTEDELDEELYGAEEETGPCAPAEIRMNVPMPLAPIGEGGEEKLEEELNLVFIE